ncbi:antibiotic biosynthesis monooxygenase [Herbaspirillum frisingense]|nr:antibiotic biosynthesis monooxygenase [Herbaspirillum frisingense]
MNKTLVVVATLIANPGHGAELRTALEKVVPPSRKEEGCLRYDLHVDQESPDRFVMLEEWRDAQALKEHESTAHFKALIDAVGSIVDVQLTKLTQIA